jgi:beta-galactosidase
MDNIPVQKQEQYDIESGAFAWAEDDDQSVIAFEKPLGKEKLFMFGIGMDHNFYYQNDTIVHLAKRAGIESRFQLEEGLDITVRTHPETRSFIFIQNFDEFKKKTAIRYKGEPLFAGKELVIPQRMGLMLPVDVTLTDDLIISYGTGEIFYTKHDQDKLQLSIKVIQPEEEFVFTSTKWIPSENDNVLVHNLTENQYKVVIRSRNESESILFNPVAVQASKL